MTLKLEGLPEELWAEIFVHCLDWHTFPGSVKEALLLSHICKDFRVLAHRTPILWSQLCLAINLQKALSQAEHVKAWLGRSGSLPLTIFIFWDEGVNGDAASHPVFPEIVKYCHRWSHILLNIPIGAFGGFVSVKGNIPLLKHLSVANTAEISLYPDPDQYDMFSVAPSLRTVECVNVSLWHRFSIPWETVVHIPIHTCRAETFLAIQGRCPDLEDCTILITKGYNNHWAVPVLLRKLRSIALYPNTIGNVLGFVQYLTYPSLVQLVIGNFFLDLDNTLTQFIARSPNLQLLTFEETFLSDNGLIEVLRCTPNLLRLKVSSPNLTVDALSFFGIFSENLSTEMNASSNENPLVPKLTHLALAPRHQLDAKFFGMIESRAPLAERRTGIAALGYLSLALHEEPDGMSTSSFDRLRSLGVQVSLKVFTEEPTLPLIARSLVENPMLEALP
jgi:hypothetical protein